MSVVLKEMESFINGVDKEQFESSLQYISEQLRRVDLKLVTKVQDEIDNDFKQQQRDIKNMETIIRR